MEKVYALLCNIFCILDYQNVDCEQVTVRTVANKTKLKWPLSLMYVDTYIIELYSDEEKSNNSIRHYELSNTNNKTNSIVVYDLDFETK